MATPPRRPDPAPVRQAPPTTVEYEVVDFLNPDIYSQGFVLPEGDWVMYFEVKMNTFTNRAGQSTGQAKLGVEAQCYNLNNLTVEPRLQWWSMGSDAHLSYAPHPDGAKQLVKIPGGPGAPLAGKTNWSIFLQSLRDSGLPETVSMNDLNAIDGIWVHTMQIDEPEERKNFGKSKTGAAALNDQQEERKGPSKIAIVTEIKDGGKPWEGTGGLPSAPVAVATPAPPKPLPRPAAPRPAPVAAPRPAPVPVTPPPAAAVAEGDDEVETAAMAALSGVLGSPENLNLAAEGKGIPKLKIRTAVFSAVKVAYGGDTAMASTVIDTYFSSDENLNGLLGQLGYVAKGAEVQVA